MSWNDMTASDAAVALAGVALNTFLALSLWMYRATFLLQIERLVDRIQGQAARRAKNMYLAGNFGPVKKEVQADALPVEGKLPKELDGVYARIGPNPVLPINGDYHWFDGDGMVHAVRIKDGAASYANRLVQTHRLANEKQHGFAMYQKFGDMHGWGGLWHAGLAELRRKVGVTPKEQGAGTANTALVCHAGKLLALHEGDLPYALRIACNGIIDTLGRVTFDGKVKHPFTAHPKADPITGELFFIGYQIDAKPPGCWYAGLDAKGALAFDHRVELKEGVMMHDMAVTQDYGIIVDTPLVFRPEVMVTQNRLPLVFDKSRPTRFGVLPKRPKSGKDIRWFEAPPVVIFHVANAWQETPTTIKLFACAFKEFELDMKAGDIPDEGQPRLTEYTLDLETGDTSTRQVADVICDFPRVPLDLVGQRSRYAYAACQNTEMSGRFSGIVKFDLTASNGSAVVGKIEHGPDCFGGEAVFVPAGIYGTGEDAGYLVTYVHDEGKDESCMAVYDARTMSSTPVARVRLPQRVPYGFHGEWLSEAQFAAQAKGL